MKKIKAVIVFLAMLQSLFAQTDDLHGFAVIKDKDGFTNIRKDADAQSEIVGTIKDSELFYCRSNEGHEDWYEIETKDTSGYIHKSRIQSLENLPHEKGSKQVKDTLSFTKPNLSIKIVRANFFKSEHKIVKESSSSPFLIDGKRVWGVDYGKPRGNIQSIQSIDITIGDAMITIPKSELANLFNPHFGSGRLYFKDKDTFYIVMSIGESLENYDVAFAIKNKKYVKGYIFFMGY